MATNTSRPRSIFGRSRELRRLDELIERVGAGSGSVLLVSGEAGIGKSTLLDHLGAAARDAGWLVLTGRCYDLAMTPPYGPWLEIFTSRAVSDVQQDLQAGIEPFRVSPEQRSAELLNQVEQTFHAMAARQPLLIALEDMHWADDASLEALRRAGRTLGDHPILLVITYRDDELNRHHPLYRLLPTILRESRPELMALRSLTRHDIEAWASSRYGLESAKRNELVDYLENYSDGNPFFIGELMRTLEEDRLIEQTPDGVTIGDLGPAHVPFVLRQVLERAIDSVSDDARELLAAAAMIGQVVPLDLWQRVTGADMGELESIIGDFVACGVLESADRPGEMVFRHALIREVLYQDILPPRRQVWHRHIADALQQSPAPDPDEVAYHLRLAGDPRAVEWLIRAGDRAFRELYALGTAALRYEAALDLTGARHDLLEDRAWILVRLASVKRYSDPRQALMLINDASGIAIRLGDDGLAALCLWLRGVMRFMAGENGLADSELGDRALAELDPANQERLRRKLMGGRALDEVARKSGLVWWHGYHGLPQAAFDLAEALEGRYESSRSGAVSRAHSEAGRAFALSVLGRLPEARAAYQAARQLFDEHRFEFMSVTMTAFEFHLIDMRFSTTDIRERRRKAEILFNFGKRGLQELVDLPPATVICGHLFLEGKWSELAGIRDTVRSLPSSIFIWNYGAPVLASLARHTGQLDRARDLLRMLLPQGPDTDAGQGGVPIRSMEALRLGADIALDANDPDEARRWIDAHSRWLAWSGYLVEQAEGSLLRARYYRVAGDSKQARQLIQQTLLEASNPDQPLVLLAAYRLLGELDLDRRRYDDSERNFTLSLQLADRCAAPFERATTLLAWARLDVALGRGEQASKKLGEVIEICEPLDARPSLDRARSLLEEIGRVSDSAVISARERQILVLVAEGLTDREVADRLFISPRTVNQHLRSIYNKLGVTSRAAATRRGIELGIL